MKKTLIKKLKSVLPLFLLGALIQFSSCTDDNTKNVSHIFVSPEDEPNEPLKIISYNILEGMKMDKTSGKQDFAAWVKSQNPDILALQEVNGFTEAKLLALAKLYGHENVSLLKLDGYPVAITSKKAIKFSNIRKVTDGFVHGYIRAEVGGFNFIVTHFSPTTDAIREKEVKLLMNIITQNPSTKRWVLMGDLNSVSPLDRKHLGENKYYNIQQQILDCDFLDVYHLRNSKFVPTCPTESFITDPDKLTRYDYIYVSSDLKNKVLDSRIIIDEFTRKYSDHYPIYLKLYKD